ncbi:hypothetical protein D9611_010934 [Ephemerocybe angulata]|uniref:Integrase catalytic domain-containing protein n=1 Tax=Ephemerocybe angulata TaxID=980116 RepID=A0A8H5FFS7_9AGAR|nr:hypothetical protein D9611_010934 [Tulosesus angulatus]
MGFLRTDASDLPPVMAPHGGISSLPDELLETIFDHTLALSADRHLSLNRCIMQVCHQWRDLALHFPPLWSTLPDVSWDTYAVSGPSHTAMNGKRDAVLLYLERSRAHPITFTLHIDNWHTTTDTLVREESERLFEVLVSHSHRWASADLDVPFRLLRIHSGSIKGRLPQLKFLSLKDRSSGVLRNLGTNLQRAGAQFFPGLVPQVASTATSSIPVHLQQWSPSSETPFPPLPASREISQEVSDADRDLTRFDVRPPGYASIGSSGPGVPGGGLGSPFQAVAGRPSLGSHLGSPAGGVYSNPWAVQRQVEEEEEGGYSSSRSHSPDHESRPWTNVTRRSTRGRGHQRSHVTFRPSTSTPRNTIFPYSPHTNPTPPSLFENPFNNLEVEEEDSFYAPEVAVPAHSEQVELEDVPVQEEVVQQSGNELDVKLEALEAGNLQGGVMGDREGTSRGVHEEEAQGSLAAMHEGLAIPSDHKQSPLPSQWGLPPPQYFQGGWGNGYNQPNILSPHHQTSAYGMWSQPQQTSTGAPYGGVPPQPQRAPQRQQPVPQQQPAQRQRPPLPQPPQQYGPYPPYQPQVQQPFGFPPANNPYATMYAQPGPGFAPQNPGYPGGYPAPPGPGGYGQQMPVGYPVHAQRKQPNTEKGEMLKGSGNYAVWSAWAQELVTSLGLLSHISRPGDPFLRVTQQPSYPPPAANAATNPLGAWSYEEWWLNDDVVHYVVTSRLDPSIATSVPRIVTMANGAQAKATSRDVWNYLYRTYGAGQITTTLSAWTKATSKTFTVGQLNDIPAYILEFRRAYDAMVVAGQVVSYESVHNTLADALPDVGGIAVLVREFRADADAQSASHPHIALEKVQIEVANYLAKHPQSARPNNNKKSSGAQPSGGGRNRPWCDTCSTSGHWARYCFQRGGAMEGKKEEALRLSSEEAKKAKSARQGGQGGGGSGGGSRQGVAAAGVGATSGGAGDAPPADGLGRDGAPPVNIAGVVVDTARNIKEFECYVETAMLVDKDKAKLFPPGCEYLLDSGCTSHLINDRSAFWDFEDVPTHSMTTANCGSLPTRGRGTIKLSLAGAASDGSDLVLVMKRALYSPDAPCSLISVGTLQEKGVGIEYLPAPVDETYIRFGPLTPWDGLSVKAGRLGKLSFIPATIKYPPGAAAAETTLDEPSVVAAATSDDATVTDELRALRDLTVDETALAAANIKIPTPHRWHERLGHLGRDRTKQFLTGSYATGITYSGPFEDKICPPCVVGKGARAPIPNPGNRATKPLERLHIDICGPHEVTSLSASRRGRFKYWLVILDDFTNYGFVALLPDRSSAGVLAAFTKATARWELLTGEKVKCVRMDGAKEFVGAWCHGGGYGV